MKNRAIASTGRAAQRPGNHDFRAAHVSSSAVGADLDPIIGIDHFEMRAPKFAPHPHAGFSAVTYLFEDSEGDFINRDSLGDSVVAHPGALIWTVAGSGVMHEEYPRVRGERVHGLQMFVNLAATEKLQEPHMLFVDGPDVPVVVRGGARIRVMAGDIGDARGRITPPGDVTFLDVKLEASARFEQSFAADASVLAYVIGGSVLAGEEERPLAARDAASFGLSEGSVLLRSGAEGAHVVLVAGRPLREPLVSHGPFVMNDESQIASAIERFRAGRMGTLTSTSNA